MIYLRRCNRVSKTAAWNLSVHRSLSSCPFPLDIDPEVEAAIRAGAPIVALESTIISHGMPYPTNVKLAKSLETIVRQKGAVPATIGIIHGRAKIGLKERELEILGNGERSVVKVSRRDLAPVMALGRDGGTTISGTMILAALAGIKVFATGGLGGVHRGGETSWDVSADLTELGRTPVAVVAAGVKSILDIGRTLEYLETQGVTLATFGNTDDFPAFFSPSSGYKSPWAVTNATDAARIIQMSHLLGLQSGQFFGVPIPEMYHAAGAAIQAAVDQAVRESEAQGINKQGKEATPWLLKRVAELSRGRSLESNVALIENTTSVGADIAIALSELQLPSRLTNVSSTTNPSLSVLPLADLTKTQTAYSPFLGTQPNKPHQLSKGQTHSHPPPSLVVFGAAAVDVTAKATSWVSQSTSPGIVNVSMGGVARNIAEAAQRSSRTPGSVLLVSPVGDDAFGKLLRSQSELRGLRTDGLITGSGRTSVCNLVLDGSGDLVGGVADFERPGTVTPDEVKTILGDSVRAVTLDANFQPVTMTSIIKKSKERGLPVWYEPTSTSKCHKIFPAIQSWRNDVAAERQPPITYTSPNIMELDKMYSFASGNEDLWDARHLQQISAFGLMQEYRSQMEQLAIHAKADFLVQEGIVQQAVSLLPYFQHVVVKCGQKGVLVVMVKTGSKTEPGEWRTDIQRHQVAFITPSTDILVVKYFRPLHAQPSQIVSTTGAGDTLVGALLASLTSDDGFKTFSSPDGLERAVMNAQKAAVLSLKSSDAVSPMIEPSTV